MKVVGIITEYNPFHHGHHYQLQAAKQATQADVLVVIMSGNVVQRGEFAVLDKWQRGELAVRYGADLVLELPLLASLQSADYFARMGVELLASIGCETLVFGTESATTDALEAHVTWLNDNETHLQPVIQSYLAQGFSYAAAMQMALDELSRQQATEALDNWDFDPSSPNHLLGIQYIKANRQLTKPMEIVTIPRLHSLTPSEAGIQLDSQVDTLYSGSQIRQLWQRNELKPTFLPQGSYEELLAGRSVNWEDYWPLLKYQLTCHRPETLSQIFGVKEGLEHLLLKQLDKANSLAQYRQALLSKRWTQASIQRILLAILLNIQADEWETYRANFEKQPLLRILAYQSTGQQFLKQVKLDKQVELFSNYKQSYQNRYQLVLRADQILALNPRVTIPEQNYSRYPIQVDG